MVKYILRAICLVIISLIVLVQMARAAVTHNVTFTVKNSGVVETTSNIGSFTDDMSLTVTGSEMPSEFNIYYRTVTSDGTRWVLTTPVGYNMLSEPGPDGYRLPLSLRLKFFHAIGSSGSTSNEGSCDGGSPGNGNAYINTDNKPFSYSGCSSRYWTNLYPGGGFSIKQDTLYFVVRSLTFSFMEDIGGKNGLTKMKLPAGTYRYPTQNFFFRQDITNGVGGSTGSLYGQWYVNVTVVVEPFIGSVNIPTALPLDVAVESGNQLTGQGSVLATVTGTLGRNLKILPASTNNGHLVKGAERIPYTLSVVPLSGDNKSRLLIDGNKGGAQQEVVIDNYEKRDRYQFRFDASFATTFSNLSSGRFSDNVTLIFTTTDLP